MGGISASELLDATDQICVAIKAQTTAIGATARAQALQRAWAHLDTLASMDGDSCTLHTASKISTWDMQSMLSEVLQAFLSGSNSCKMSGRHSAIQNFSRVPVPETDKGEVYAALARSIQGLTGMHTTATLQADGTCTITITPP